MILRTVVREKLAEYFRSPHWTGPLGTMAKGRREVMHAHVYCDSILSPASVQSAVETYLDVHGISSERKIRTLSHGRGYTNVYYIQPRGMCHFEVFLRFNPDVVLAPMAAAAARGGKSFDYWTPEFMTKHYQQFEFTPMGEAERDAVEAYFRSPAWRQIYGTMFYDNERAIHSHCIVNTSLSPEDILPLGCHAIEERGWEVDRAVSIVFNVNGLDQGKITFLVRRPELVLELEWQFDRNVVIEPAIPSIARITTSDMVDRDTAGLPYLELNGDDLDWLGNTLRGG